MSVVRDFAIKHPVVAFFILTYLISWPLFFGSMFIFEGNMVAGGTLGAVAGFGPVFAGMMVTAATANNTVRERSIKRPAAFMVAWLFSWVVMVLYIWRARGATLQAGIVIFAGLLAVLPAYVISGAFSRRALIRRYLSTLIRPKGNPAWYVVALFTFPAIQFLGYIITKFAGSDPGEFIRGGFSFSTINVIVITFLFGFLFTGGINEESGWRGFAIPRLQQKFSPLIAAGIVWFFWALWHLPYDISMGDNMSGILFNRIFFNFLWAILFVWVYNGTGGSILAPALFHSAMNTSSEFFSRTDMATYLFAALAIYAVVSGRMWMRLSLNDSKNEGVVENGLKV